MGCASSKFNIPIEGHTSHLYTRLPLADSCHSSKPADEDRDHEKREEACSDKDLNDTEDEMNPYLQSLSFKIYCVPSQFDNGNSEDESNTEEIKEEQKRDVQIYYQGSRSGPEKTNIPRKERKSYKSRFFRYIYRSPRDSIIKLKSTFGRFS